MSLGRSGLGIYKCPSGAGSGQTARSLVRSFVGSFAGSFVGANVRTRTFGAISRTRQNIYEKISPWVARLHE